MKLHQPTETLHNKSVAHTILDDDGTKITVAFSGQDDFSWIEIDDIELSDVKASGSLYVKIDGQFITLDELVYRMSDKLNAAAELYGFTDNTCLGVL
jgi:hypothetical protein